MITLDNKLDLRDRVLNLGPPNLRYGLVGWWRDRSGLDYSGYGNNVTPGSSSSVRRIAGLGNAFALNATIATALIRTQAKSSINSNTFTYACWVNINSTGLFKVVYGGNTVGGQPQMIVNNANPATVYIGINGSSTLNSPATITVGKWYHIATSLAYPANIASVYINGVRVAFTAAFAGSAPVYTGTQLGIGGNSGFIFDGLIADMRVYNRVVSDAEIYQLYSLPFTTGFGFESSNTSVLAPQAVFKDLTGSIIPSTALAGALAPLRDLSGSIIPATALSGSLSVNATIDLAGAVAPATALAGTLDVSNASAVDLTGTIRPTTALSGFLGSPVNLTGSITPTISIRALFGTVGDLIGAVAPHVSFAGDLSVTPLGVVELVGLIEAGGSLRAQAEIHPLWQDPCILTQGSEYGERLYGVDAYAAEANTDACCAPFVWTPQEPCDFGDSASGASYGDLLYGRNAYGAGSSSGGASAYGDLSYGKNAFSSGSRSASSGWRPASEESATVTWKKEEPCSG